MPDPDDLTQFLDGLPPVRPLPAAEVRRRGDRLRARNTALAVGGGILAAALAIGAPVVALSGHDGRGDDPVGPSPTPTTPAANHWLAAVPAQFPLAQGLPSPHTQPAPVDSAGRRPVTADLVPVCGAQDWALDGSVAAETASYTGESEDQAARTIALFPDADSARRALMRLQDAVVGCPDYGSADGGDPTLVNQPVDVELGGEESFSFSQQARFADGLLSNLTVVEVARTGNALLFDSAYGSVGGDAAVRAQTLTLHDRSEPTRSVMCLFAANPCTVDVADSSAPAAPAGGDIPAGFRLIEDQPVDAEGTLTGPGRDVDGVSLADLCGSTAWPPTQSTDRLAATISGPEYELDRELVTFADADQAVAAVQAVREAVAACPVDKADRPGDDQIVTALDDTSGYDSVTFGQTYRVGLGGGVYQFVRVGRAVLATVEGGEYGSDSVAPGARALTRANAAVTTQMCVFTAAGC